MLQVFHAKWHSRLPEGESSEYCDIIAELRGSTFVPRRSEDRLEIEMLKESLWWQDEEMRQWDEVQRQWDDFYAHIFA
jgi:hypothetical protein